MATPSGCASPRRTGASVVGIVDRRAVEQRQHRRPCRVVEAHQPFAQFREIEFVLHLVDELAAIAAIHRRIERGDDPDRAADAQDEAFEFGAPQPFDLRERAAGLLGAMLHDPGDLPLRLVPDDEQAAEAEQADAADQRGEQPDAEADVPQRPADQVAEARGACRRVTA